MTAPLRVKENTSRDEAGGAELWIAMARELGRLPVSQRNEILSAFERCKDFNDLPQELRGAVIRTWKHIDPIRKDQRE